MDSSEFKKSFEKGTLLPVYAITGDEEFFAHETLDLIKRRVLEGQDHGLTLSELEGNDATAEAVFSELNTVPFMGAASKRLVVINHADDFVRKNEDAFIRYLESPSPFSCLVLLTRDSLPGSVSKKFSRVGLEVSCKKMRDAYLTSWIAYRAQYYGKGISTEASNLLTEDTGNNLFQLDKHLEKLATFVGDRKTIELGDVEALVYEDRSRRAFDLTEAMARKDTSKAIKILHQLLRADEETPKIIGLIAWQLRRLWQVRRALDNGEDVSELNIPPYQLRSLLEQAKLFHEEELEKVYKNLLETDVESKTSGMDTKLLLESLIFRLCK